MAKGTTFAIGSLSTITPPPFGQFSRKRASPGQVYDIGGSCEQRNIDLLHSIVHEFARIQKENPEQLLSLITHVDDRPGHDFRYAIDCSKIKQELGWQPLHNLSSGLRKTIAWYLDNPERLT